MAKLAFIFLLALSSQVLADLTINALEYDRVTDDLVVTAQFPGKCLDHQLHLTKTKAKGLKNYFRLEVSNNGNDPCNAINQQSARFSLEDITERPAEILVSPHADGSRPHFITIPVHAAADIMKVRNQDNGSLVFSLRFKGPLDTGRFYVAMDCSNAHGPVCEGIVRDKYAHKYAQAPMQTKDVTLVPKNLPRSQTLAFTFGNKRQAVRILIP